MPIANEIIEHYIQSIQELCSNKEKMAVIRSLEKKGLKILNDSGDIITVKEPQSGLEFGIRVTYSTAA